MRKIYTATLLFFIALATAQCPPGSINLTSQAQVDAFAATYPNCTAINGDVDIHGNDITNLSPLAGLQSVSGHLWVYFCPELVSLNGLENIASVGSMDVSYNNTLSDISALGNLTTVPGNMGVKSNPMLQSLNGLHNITTVGGLVAINGDGILNFNGLSSLTSIGFFLEIKNNPALTSVDGLSNLGSLANNGYLEVSGNAQLTSLQGLNNIDPTTINAFVLSNNPQLTFCSIPNVCQYVSSIGGATINNNATGCNNETQILAACSLGTTDFEALELSVWPNPTRGMIHFDTPETIQRVEIFDLLGQRLFSGNQKQIDLSVHGPAIYTYRVTTTHSNYVGKLVLQ